jgi:N-acetylneuraminic acid mutarotase
MYKKLSFLNVALVLMLAQCTSNSTLLDDTAKALAPTTASTTTSDAELTKKLRSIWLVGGTRTAGQPAAAVATGAYATDLDYYDPETNSWGTVAASSWTGTFQPRLGAAYAGYNGKIYVIGGYSEGATVANALRTDTVQIYDVATNTWSTGANLPAAIGAPAATQLGGKIYVFSGSSGANASAFTASATHYVYDIASDSWATAAAPTGAQSGSEMCMVNDGITLWKVGGKTAAATVAVIASYIPINITVTPFVNGGVTFGAAGLTVRTAASCLYIPASGSTPARIMLIGGYSAAAANTTPLSALTTGTATTTLVTQNLSQYVEYPFTGSWSSTPNLPQARASGATVLKGSIMYYFGGNSFVAATAGAGNVNWSSSSPSQTVYAAQSDVGFWQNKIPNTTTSIPVMPTARWGHGAVLVQ